jgi:hypothetical protein
VKNYLGVFLLREWNSRYSLVDYIAEVGTIGAIAITLRYVFALLHNALCLWRIVIASDSYRFRLFAGVIASDSYCSELAGQRYRFTALSLWATYASIFASREVTAYFGNNTLDWFLPHTARKKEITQLKSYHFFNLSHLEYWNSYRFY